MPATVPLHAAAPSPRRAPRLLADIGGTNARFALETAAGELAHIQVLPCAGYATFSDALRAYLDSEAPAAGARPELAAIAIANPVSGDLVSMTNHHWQFSVEAVRREFGLARLLMVNDFRAKAAGARSTARAATSRSPRPTNASSPCCASPGAIILTCRPKG